MIWHDFNAVSVAEDGEHSWTVIREWPNENGKGWMAISSQNGVNMVSFETREAAKQSCEDRRAKPQ